MTEKALRKTLAVVGDAKMRYVQLVTEQAMEQGIIQEEERSRFECSLLDLMREFKEKTHALIYDYYTLRQMDR